MAHIDENTKITLTIGQLKKLLKEDSWGEYDDDGNYIGAPVEDISDAIRTMFYWIEQNTNLEIKSAKSIKSPSTRDYQLWGKPNAFRDKDEFEAEVALIKEQLDILDLSNYLFIGSPLFQRRDDTYLGREYTCHLWFSKCYAFDFNAFKKETRPKDNYNYQNRYKIKKIDHPSRPKIDTPF